MERKRQKFRAHSALTPSKDHYDLSMSAKRIDTPSEIESRSSLFLVEKSGAKVEDIVQNMRKLCSLAQLEPFFAAYASYKEVIGGLLDQSNTILRKLSPSFQRPTYNISEDIRVSHETFITAASHLNLRIQPAYSDTVAELVNRLPLDFEMFVHRYRKNTQVKQFLRQVEPKLLDDITAITRELKIILRPIEFDFLNPMKVLVIIERLREINRDFEMRIMGGIRQKVPNMRVPAPQDTEWHKTMITLVPILSNLPMFVDSCKELAQALPDLTDAIEQLCHEIDELVPERIEKITETAFVQEANPVDEIVDRASEFLNVDLERKGTRASRIGSVIQAAEETVKSLRRKVEQQEEEKVNLEKKLKKDKISDRLKQIRATTDEVAKRYAMEKDTFITGAVKRLKGLVKEEMYDSEDPDPNREFNKIVQRLSKELSALREASNDGTREKLIGLLQKVNPQEQTDSLTTDDLITKLAFYIDDRRELSKSGQETDVSSKTINEELLPAKKTSHDGKNETMINVEDDISKLKKVIEKHRTTFLPASKHFQKFKDRIATLKQHICDASMEDLTEEMRSVLVKSVDMFEVLGHSLSAAEFAPEYSGNYQIVAGFLESQRVSGETIAKLQNTIKEQEDLLSSANARIRVLEEEYCEYQRLHP